LQLSNVVLQEKSKGSENVKHVVEELEKSCRYHLRQLEENLQKIRTYEETIKDLTHRNESHKEAITEIKVYLEQIEKAEELPLNLPLENNSNVIISGSDEI
jgi:predicted RNase H-like nuclease (RuvC/YqgF family)